MYQLIRQKGSVKDATFAQLTNLGDKGELSSDHLIVRVQLKADQLTLRHLNDEFFKDVHSDEALKRWLLGHLTDYMIGAVDAPLLNRRLGADVREVAAETIDAALAPIHPVQPRLQRVWHLFVRERLRRETTASLHMFQNFVEVRLPLSSTRRSTCHCTAWASARHSTSRPAAVSSSGPRVWSTRVTSCSMIGPSSRSELT